MTTKFDIKQLASGMHVYDKVRLIIADVEELIKTDGAKGLLSPDEKEAIFKDAQKNKEIREINRIYELYKLCALVYEDLNEKVLLLAIATGETERVMTAIHVGQWAHDAIIRIFYDLGNDHNQEALYKKYAIDLDFLSHYGLLTEGETGEPNIRLQKCLVEVVKRAKKVRGAIYKAEYVQAKTEVRLISEHHQKLINECNNTIKKLIDLDVSFRLFRVFRDYDILTEETTTEPKFIETIRNMEQALTLSEEDKQQVRKRVEKYLEI